jgi:hypothetical protein
MPENAVSVTRPGKWGNPFKIGDPGLKTIKDVLECYRNYITMHIKDGALDISELKGKDLACWCKEGEDCHGSILLEIVNS